MSDDEPKPMVARPSDERTIERQRQEVLARLSNALYEQSATTVNDAIGFFAKIDPMAEEPPEEWVAELGEARAWERFRTAKYATMAAKDAPVALAMAAKIYVGVSNAQALRGGAPTLNVQHVHITAPIPKFDVIDVTAEEKKK